jgi:chaperonin GroES
VLKTRPTPLAGEIAGPHLLLRGRQKVHAGYQKTITVQLFRRTAMKFRPLHDRVVVKRIDAEEKTAGGIIIPDTAQEKPSQGEIVAVGPGGRDESGKLIPIDLKVGDTVLFGKWSGTEVKIDGKDLLIMKESDIMGVIEGGAAAKKKAA